ncbi:hypothetical protein [Sandaracinus amylolyticus]|uniref:Uncharacterized protein n=1 Tax=Sandaracinus amylolyticus TaxID=927083 RepID=A0A0F6W8X6_9BACT|nr:hypothetical protein [Sandaracinus amylolyticus]AKF10371.1 hypothetical protein DB32_007520 [Sandaracinus amylolyticus]
MARRARDPIAIGLVALTSLVAIAGACAEIGGYVLGWPDALVELVALSFEANVPTWYASALLVLASAALVLCAERAPRDRGAWLALAAIFAFASLDEAIEIHEHLGGLFEGRGVLYFSWVIPGALVVVLLALAFGRFLLRLPVIDRRRFVLAAVIFVSGALGMELPLGWWTERAGDDNLVYGMLDWVEETLELAGTTTFLLALRARLMREHEA